MLVSTKGIVLHHFKYSEKSIIVKIYTEDFGLQSYVVNGVRSSKSKNKAVYLQPLSLVELSVIHKEKKGLQNIKNISLVIPYSDIPFNIIKTSIAFFLAEVLYKTIREEEANESLFNFLFNAFQILDLSKEQYVNFHLVFLGSLTKYIGIAPQSNHSHNSPLFFDLQEGVFTNNQPFHKAVIENPISDYFEIVLNASLNDINLSITNATRKVLLQLFLDYYHLHLSNFDNLKSIAILEEVLN